MFRLFEVEICNIQRPHDIILCVNKSLLIIIKVWRYKYIILSNKDAYNYFLFKKII